MMIRPDLVRPRPAARGGGRTRLTAWLCELAGLAALLAWAFVVPSAARGVRAWLLSAGLLAALHTISTWSQQPPVARPGSPRHRARLLWLTCVVLNTFVILVATAVATLWSGPVEARVLLPLVVMAAGLWASGRVAQWLRARGRADAG